MINWAVFCHCTHISYTGLREHVHENRFSIQYFLLISYQMIERECITQEINYRNSSPNKLNSVIICYPSCILTSMTTNTMLPVCLMADWEALNINSTTQNVQAAQGNSRGIKCPLNTETSDSPLEKLWVQKTWNTAHDSYGLLVRCFCIIFGPWQAIVIKL